MEGFTYIDIFETKGIEYLVIIAFLLILIPFWILLNKESSAANKIYKKLGILTAGILKIPQGLFFSKNHTWAFLDKSGIANVGLDDFLIKIVGDVRLNLVKISGNKVKKGELLIEIIQNGKRLVINSPISGEVILANNSIVENPTLLHQDPYAKGWIYKIRPSDWKSENRSFYLGEEASNWIKNELTRFKDFVSVSLGKYSSEPSMITLQEGGELRQNILSELEDKIWIDFQESFLIL